MKLSRIVCLFGFVLFQVGACFAHHMAVVVNKGNGATNISSSYLAKIVKADTRKWTNGTDIVLVLHKASKGEMLTLQKLNHMSEQELKSRLEGRKDGVILVDSDDDVLDTVGATPGAIGLVEVRSVNNKVKVVKVDGKLPLENGYLPD
ncbi:MAG: substrate-binding domain-containing protein [Terriglobales bacterium]